MNYYRLYTTTVGTASCADQLQKAPIDQLLEVALPELLCFQTHRPSEETFSHPEAHQLVSINNSVLWEPCSVEDARFESVWEVIDAYGE